MKIELDQSGSAFLGDGGQPLFAEQLVSFEEAFLVQYPQVRICYAYWDVSFEYYYIDHSKSKIDALLVLKNKQRTVKIIPPNFLLVDYVCVNGEVIPLRRHDFELLREFLPTLDHDGVLGFTIKELMNFDYFVSTNGILVGNPELKDKALATRHIEFDLVHSGLEVHPYPYQAVGIEWLRSLQALGRKGAILGDVMGLGKTLQAIGLIACNVCDGKADNIVVCPGTLVENWRRELKKFSPRLRVCTHFGAFRTGASARLKGYDVVLTSYDTLVRDHSIISDVSWNLVVIDEAQAIKNPNAKRTVRCKELPRKFGLALSGTPLENRLMDLWSLADFAEPGLFGSESKFESEFEGSPSGATEVNRIIRPILLRRRLDEIDHQLPAKVVINHPIRWPVELNELYEKVRKDAIKEFAIAGGLVATARLRKLTTHPLMMDVESDDMTTWSPKYALALEILEELFANGEKCLVFVSYKKMIDCMKLDLENRFPNSYVQSLDGRTEMSSRSPLVDAFNSFNGSGVLICNPIVAGAGLNITGANHVIHYNLEWNPAKEDQATFRVYRNGQLKETFIHRLFFIDTIDEVIDERIQVKRNLADLSVDATVTNEDYYAGLQASPLSGRDD
jgi:SNF2 family DNA or RNA helicase